ncbi:hypothetical protein A6E15_16510 [Natrinema saccharevitans]|uniref:Blue (type 1) copper domain-containing protein n=1 Tax=Natrinema saccharevitans TaxID=301967 RepID=A0A1S8B0D1_9EURY|nr:plastocyanin/azurin family copper-binding protein [Natrinema saccharevitans]OLZ42465.1 hypothetical protein A6E15_16510 [Natrinema saccharevitans]
MKSDSDRTRRRLLRTAGLTAATGVLAGCLEESTTDDPGGSTDDGDGDEPDTGDETDGDDGSGADGSDGDEASDGDGTTDAADADSETDPEDGETEPTETDREYEIEPGTEILFGGETTEWVGLEPSAIEGVANPTLVLEAGEEYTIGWTEGDGAQHNVEIWDENEDVVDGLETELAAEPDEGQRLTVTASEEMAAYVCHPHTITMQGTIRVRSGEYRSS